MRNFYCQNWIPQGKSALLGLLFILWTTPSYANICRFYLESSALIPYATTNEPSAGVPLVKNTLSRTLRDPLIGRAMEIRLVDDFKSLVDLVPKNLTEDHRMELLMRAESYFPPTNEQGKLSFLLNQLYETRSELLPLPDAMTAPRYTLSESSPHKPVFDYIEATWKKLLRRTPEHTESTLIPLPYPIMIPGSRFQEAYYWDSFFAVHTLIRTGRSDLVRGQINNFLFMIKNYGLVPNGNRDYYLSRSQPPLLSRMVRVYLESKKGILSPKDIGWLAEEVIPLIKKDYLEFWMNPETRWDPVTGLNHHYDAINLPRPERHASDLEEIIAKTYRDVRAEAESGKDFTAAFLGEATKVTGVLLNSILYGVEQDLAWFYSLIGDSTSSQKFLMAAQKRKSLMNKYLRDPASGLYFDYHLVLKQRVPVLTADTFVPLYMGMVNPAQARRFSVQALSRLEVAGGITGSDVVSSKQWDAPFGWAPHIMFAVDGLRKYGQQDLALRLAKKWTGTIDRSFAQLGTVLEKYDVVRAAAPIENGDKYTTQQGFLWTNGVYSWIVHDVFKEPLHPLH